MTGPVICWFKRDLRVADHPALHMAAGLGPVLPVYILEPELWRQDDASGRQYAFLTECLTDLREDLARAGLSLVLRVGDAVEVLDDLRRSFGAAHLVSQEETGNGWTYARDRRVAGWARGAGVPRREFPHSAVVRRLDTRDRWASRREAVMRAEVIPAPTRLAGVAEPSDPLPVAD